MKAAAGAAPISIKDVRQAIVSNRVTNLDLNSLLMVIDAEKNNNADTIKFLISWAKLFNKQLKNANAQQFSEVLYNLGRLDYYDDNLLHNLVNLAKDKVGDFGYQEVSKCLYGLGRLKFYDQEFTNRIIMRFIDSAGQIDSSDMANLIYGISKLEYYNQQFLDKFTNIALEKIHELDPQDVAKIFLGMAKIGYRNQDLLDALINKANHSKDHFNQMSLSNTAYALTMILKNNHPNNPEIIENLIVELVQRIDCSKVKQIEEKRQLLSVYYALNLEKREELADLAERLRISWDREIEKEAKSTAVVSNAQARMASYTRELASNLHEEYYIKELGVSVDIYIPSINTVIQVDGPKHFHNSNHLEVNATTEFNSKRITELGYNLLRVRTDDENYQGTIRNFISEKLTEVRKARKTRAFLASNRAKEMDDATFEANFAGMSMMAPKIEASRETVAIKEAAANTEAVEPKTRAKSNKKQAAKSKGKKAIEEDDFDKILAEHNQKMAAEEHIINAPKPVAKPRYNSELIEAVTKRNLGKAQQLLRQGASPDAVEMGEQGLSVLCIACINADLRMVRLLLDAGANPNTTNEEGTTALFAAAYIDNPTGTEIVKLLLNAGAHANTARVDGETPLLQAMCKNIDSAKIIIQAGANLNVADKNNVSVLHLAAEIGDLELVKRIIADDQVDLNMTHKGYIQTPIHASVSKNDYDVTEALADAGADLDVKNVTGSVLIGEAIKNGNFRIFRLLLDKGANPNIRIKVSDADMEITPLLYCASNNLGVEWFKKLIYAGADVNALSTGVQGGGLSSIGFAIDRKNTEVVKLILASGVDLTCSKSYEHLLKDNWVAREEINKFKSDPIKYITDYDQPAESKIRALDKLLEQHAYKSLNGRIAETKERLSADLWATEAAGYRDRIRNEREARGRR